MLQENTMSGRVAYKLIYNNRDFLKFGKFSIFFFFFQKNFRQMADLQISNTTFLKIERVTGMKFRRIFGHRAAA